MAHKHFDAVIIGSGFGGAVATYRVWLDEAGLKFDHVDAASGGVFNLAMMAQGMSGSQIADNWRNVNPRSGISFNAAEFPRLLYAESLFTLDNYRKHVITAIRRGADELWVIWTVSDKDEWHDGFVQRRGLKAKRNCVRRDLHPVFQFPKATYDVSHRRTDNVRSRVSAMARFGRLFMGKLWDVYARIVLLSGPFS